MRICLAQINPKIADLKGNTEKILAAARQAAEKGAELVVFPEMAITGYPPRDLLELHEFVDGNIEALEQIARGIGSIAAIVGFVSRNEGGGRPLRNSAAVIAGGEVVSVHHKSLLPTYDVFDEDRYFEPADSVEIAKLLDSEMGITICEDAWALHEAWPGSRYRRDPVEDLAAAGANFLVNISASPYSLGKKDIRRQLMADHARRHRLPILYINQVGGNDELIFDGASMVFNSDGELVARAREFEEDLLMVDLDNLPQPVQLPEENVDKSVVKALVLGTRDFLHKCGFEQAVIGISGGIDSSVVAAIAARALGPKNVFGVYMPSCYSSPESAEDSQELAKSLGINYEVISITPAHEAMLSMMSRTFKNTAPGTAEENLQARIRGNILMAIANKFHRMVLATGNKSELAVGYCTLYGDMAGALAPLGDVPKTMVYKLGRCLNAEREVIPGRCFTKAPSAELKPNQTDQDTLPPYELLDAILKAYIEEHKSVDEIVATGCDSATAKDTVRRIEANEYKRRQAIPCLKITTKAFGYGRRVPIAKSLPPYEV